MDSLRLHFFHFPRCDIHFILGSPVVEGDRGRSQSLCGTCTVHRRESAANHYHPAFQRKPGIRIRLKKEREPVADPLEIHAGKIRHIRAQCARRDHDPIEPFKQLFEGNVPSHCLVAQDLDTGSPDLFDLPCHQVSRQPKRGNTLHQHPPRLLMLFEYSDSMPEQR